MRNLRRQPPDGGRQNRLVDLTKPGSGSNILADGFDHKKAFRITVSLLNVAAPCFMHAHRDIVDGINLAFTKGNV